MIHKLDGKILVKDGKLCSTCCVEYDEDCEYCDEGKSPRYATVEFVQGSVCLDCYNNVPLGRSVRYYPSGDVSDTYVLEQHSSDPCIWFLDADVDIGGFYRYYTTAINCVGTYSDIDFTNLKLTLVKTAADEARITIWEAGSGRALFESIYTPDTNCFGKLGLSNDLACSYSTLYTGGSVNVIEGDQT